MERSEVTTLLKRLRAEGLTFSGKPEAGKLLLAQLQQVMGAIDSWRDDPHRLRQELDYLSLLEGNPWAERALALLPKQTPPAPRVVD